MIEQLFKEILAKYTNNESEVTLLWNSIVNHYTSAPRHYHTIQHLDHLISELLPVQPQIKDWDILVLAIVYHDVIYNVLKHNNEEESAMYAQKELAAILHTEQLEQLSRFIMATASHSKSIDTDINYFTDADLSILGAGSDNYLLYTEQIRKEYRCYPDAVYKRGRLKVVAHFLQMDQIYKTRYFADKYEQQARINLMQEFERLAGKAYIA
ncbi:hypothetical protein FC093_01120 [Ilyomonas limi]|uniref:Metal-dependent phosphohydrolase n=1 Tax=Ilyomonas limi TaxID=2575867 RepID=A0A4U3L8J4_9BACT|nr:hypothetical protein [Ilyomonas limi]TKK71655.1 hypothetical protein FC093_01120 [Ilyomonas limi]